MREMPRPTPNSHGGQAVAPLAPPESVDEGGEDARHVGVASTVGSTGEVSSSSSGSASGAPYSGYQLWTSRRSCRSETVAQL